MWGSALPGILKEIVANRDDNKMLITTGGGTRSRHIYTIGLEMGMPTGIIARFGSMISDQNALMVATLLSPWGGIKMSQSDIVKLGSIADELGDILQDGALDLLG